MKSHKIFQFMRISLLCITVFVLIMFSPANDAQMRATPVNNEPIQPLLPPDTSVPKEAAATLDVEQIAKDVEDELHPENRHPSQIVIPSLKINSWVVPVGVTANGEMDVPDGSTLNVGWYKHGTIPGDVGSAVMDAHVYAAFKKLKNIKVGSTIYVYNARGEELKFKVISSKVYPLANVPMQTIFNDASGAYLNLITCAGRFMPSRNTYSHRQVVYAERIY